MEKTIGVIFDMDGVIVNSNPIHKESIRKFCKRYNKEVSESFLRNRVYGRKNSDWLPELFDSLTSEELKNRSREKEEVFREIFDPQQHTVEGLFRFIGELDKHQIPMAVATSAPSENSRYILNRLSIRNRFEAVLHTSDVDNGKPAPDIYDEAASRLNINSARCIVFEDSPTGSKAARRAGCLPVGVATTYTEKELNSCFQVIDDFTEVDVKMLETWINEAR